MSKAENRTNNSIAYRDGQLDVLDTLSSAYWGKQAYFLQDDGTIYSRFSGLYMTLEEAIREFNEKLFNIDV